MTVAQAARDLAVHGTVLRRWVREGTADLQQAFRRNHALQCGFCTAGILMSCDDYLRRKPDPTESEVRDMLSGHLCRCTGYTNIVKAVLETAQERRESRPRVQEIETLEVLRGEQRLHRNVFRRLPGEFAQRRARFCFRATLPLGFALAIGVGRGVQADFSEIGNDLRRHGA